MVSTIFAKVLIDWFEGKRISHCNERISYVLAFWYSNGTSWTWLAVGCDRLALSILYCFIVLWFRP